MSQIKFSSSRGSGIMTGILFILMGMAVLGISFGIIPTDPTSIQAPGWVLAVFGGLFVIVGIWVIFLRVVGQDQSTWINLLFALFVMAAISLICLWIGFGPGERIFVHYGTYSAGNPAMITNPILGRIFFGGFGVLLSGLTVAFGIISGQRLFKH
jgi:drug/metabolite transporter superfamily protein YnfA